VKTKRCSKCGEIKSINEFSKDKNNKDNYRGQCKNCENIRKRNYYKKNAEYFKKLARQWREEHPGYNKEYCKKRYESKPEYYRKYKKQYRKNNKEKINQHHNWYFRERNKRDINFKIRRNFSRIVNLCLRGNKNWKSIKEIFYPEYISDLKQHLESQFTDGMTWDNYGEWHIDHIKPVSWFNFTSYEDREFKQCWSLDNLQPLWAKDNLSKGNRYIG